MFVLVTGGSGSGKSEYAENLVCSLPGERRFYIATMRPWDEEGKRRIGRHRGMRAGKGFETLEQYTDLELLDLPWPGSAVLLECMSNLAANEFYRDSNLAEDRIMNGVLKLMRSCRHLVVVTNEVFSDGGRYDRETLEYMGLLGRLNLRMAALADRVTEVVYKIPVSVKGEVTEWT